MLCGQMNAQKQKGQAVNAASAQKAIDILKVLLDDFSSLCLARLFSATRYVNVSGVVSNI